MKKVKSRKLLASMILTVSFIMAISLLPNKTEASVNLIEACRVDLFESAVCVIVYNDEVYRVQGCINGALSWDSSCWPIVGLPPSND